MCALQPLRGARVACSQAAHAAPACVHARAVPPCVPLQPLLIQFTALADPPPHLCAGGASDGVGGCAQGGRLAVLASADHRARLTSADDEPCRREVDALGQAVAHPALDLALLEPDAALELEEAGGGGAAQELLEPASASGTGAAGATLAPAAAAEGELRRVRALTYRDVLAERGMLRAVQATLAGLPMAGGGGVACP